MPANLGADSGRFDVEILRDTWGVPHVFGKTDPDVAFGLAYAHAEDDFVTIQGALLAARGRLASYFGQEAAPNDYMVGLLRMHDTVSIGYPKLPEDVRNLCEAYAAGLNLYASQNWSDAIPGLYPVRGADIVAGFVHKLPLFFGMDRVLQDLFSPDREAEPANEPPTGSNTIAVSPARTSDGSTMLAVNSHQPWEGPVAWYEVHLHSEDGWDTVGGIFPGAPVVLHGHNRDLGWAYTVNKPDLIDVYELTIDPDNPDRYMVDGQWKLLERRDIPIEVKLWGPFHWTFYREALWSEYGPVVRQPKGTFAIRYAGMSETRQIEQWYRMNRARSLSEWEEAQKLRAIPMFNVGYADREGNILYLYNASVPLRNPEFDWSGTLPGDTTSTLWTAILPYDRLPRVINPASGFLQNCNSTPFGATVGPENPSGEEYGAEFGIERYDTNRALRARELFSQDSSITWDEFKSYKFDTAYSIESRMASIIETVVSHAEGTDSLTTAAIDVIRNWNMGTDPTNRLAALPVLAFSSHAQAYQTVPDTQILIDDLRHAANILQSHFDSLTPEWSLVNRLRRGSVDLGIGGAPDVLHAIYGETNDDGTLTAKAGDSYILLVRWDSTGTVHSESIQPFGSAPVDPESRHYSDQAPLFARQQLKPVWMDEALIRSNLSRAYRPGH